MLQFNQFLYYLYLKIICFFLVKFLLFFIYLLNRLIYQIIFIIIMFINILIHIFKHLLLTLNSLSLYYHFLIFIFFYLFKVIFIQF